MVKQELKHVKCVWNVWNIFVDFSYQLRHFPQLHRCFSVILALKFTGKTVQTKQLISYYRRNTNVALQWNSTLRCLNLSKTWIHAMCGDEMGKF